MGSRSQYIVRISGEHRLMSYDEVKQEIERMLKTGPPLNQNEISAELLISPELVGCICAELAAEGKLIRIEGDSGKLTIPNLPPTPTLDEMLQYKTDIDILNRFLEWLGEKGLEICQYSKGHNIPCSSCEGKQGNQCPECHGLGVTEDWSPEGYYPVFLPLLYEFFGIDPVAEENERRAILEHLKQCQELSESQQEGESNATIYNPTIYEGHRDNIDRAQVTKDDAPFLPDYSLSFCNHSPDGFNWGYGGGGPAQLALALLLDVCKDEGMENDIALRYYQKFKREFVSRWDSDWVVTSSAIVGWMLARITAEEENQH